MIAEIQFVEGWYIAKMERQINHSVEKVWDMLTINDQLAKWFSELRAGELHEGGFMAFYMSTTEIEKLEISEFVDHSILAFEWFGDTVQFELKRNSEDCLLTFTQKFHEINEQKRKDLAGWHVCLDVIVALLDGKTIDSRKKQWEKWYKAYSVLLSTR